MSSAVPAAPVIVSRPNSTRAVAMDSVEFTPEPFSAKSSSFLCGPDKSTRIMIFVLNLSLTSGETSTAVTADAEDASHRRYNLVVEHVGPIARHEWMSAVILRLDQDMGDTGDVLIQLTYQNVKSNRVRIGVGHVGGGPPDDPGTGPTPAPPYTLSGIITLAGVAFANVTVNLAGRSTAVTTTNSDGAYSFVVNAAGDYTITPQKQFYSFSPSNLIIGLANNRTTNFSATRDTFAINGTTRDDQGNLLKNISVRLEGAGIDAPRNALTSDDGSFSFKDLPAGFDYTVTPETTSVFAFASQSITPLTTTTGLAFGGTRRTYEISGVITDQAQRPLSDVTVSLSGAASGSTTTDATGRYAFRSVPAGRDYTVSVAKQFFTLIPANRSVANLTSDSTVNFGAARNTFVVSGIVKDDIGQVLDGIAVRLESSSTEVIARTVITSEGGKFSFPNVLAGFSYTITPQNTNLFAYNAQSVATLNANTTLAFSGTLRSYTIEGFTRDREQRAVGAVSVVLSGGASRIASTDANGHYAFTNLPAGRSYTVTATKTDHFVSPEPQTVNLLQNRLIDFSAIRFYIIKGKVADSNGRGLLGIIMSLTGPETGVMRTTPDGAYSFTVTRSGNYVLTPSREQNFYQFSPPAQNMSNLADHQTINFAGNIIITSPTYVMEFDGTPKSVDYSIYWPNDTNVGHFFWEFWAMPGTEAYGTYMLSDGYGGAHALLFGFNAPRSQAGHYTLLGNIWNGTGAPFYFNSDDGPSPGEWGHYAVGWDGSSIITYYDGVPVGKQVFSGPRVSTGTYNGATMLLIGGSNHQNFHGRIAQVRGFEENNPRASSPESSFVPQTVFSVDGQLVSYYFKPASHVADLSYGYNGLQHNGWPRGMLDFYFYGCNGCPTPQFVIDPTAPAFANTANPGQTTTLIDVQPGTPAGALVFDSFSRNNSTRILNGKGGLGETEAGSEGTKSWQTNVDPSQAQPFGVLAGRGVTLTDAAALAWVSTAKSDLDIRVNRGARTFGSGTNTGLAFRVVDKNNFFFAYTSDDPINPSGPRTLSVGYYQSGVRTMLASGISISPTNNWTTLRVVTTPSAGISVYAGTTLLFSSSNSLFASAVAAGLFNNGPGLGLTNRWDNFTILTAP
jgi:Concanavalin A-like lectin/glucanases superfamily/Carboxypeptidase regulatory-like domain